MMKLTKNFYLSEFACNDGSEFPLTLMHNVSLLAEQLQVLRDWVGLPIKINSGYRSPVYNKQIGGVSNSQHLKAKAADIVVIGLSHSETQATIKSLIDDGKMMEGGLGCYATFTHYDIRNSRVRW
jgi:uncharacterized protein YcbK (DUF882 family)